MMIVNYIGLFFAFVNLAIAIWGEKSVHDSIGWGLVCMYAIAEFAK